MNTRPANILKNNECRGGQFLDDYNQTVYDDITPTITTKIITSCHYFIYEEDKRKDIQDCRKQPEESI